MMFIASVEVAPLPGSKMSRGQQGAFVYCLVPAESKRAARRRLSTALAEDRYRLIKTEFLREYETFRWEHTKDQVKYDQLAKKALLNDDVVYGPFYTWERSG